MLGFVASIGYAASLPLQERLVDRTSPDIRGQVLGLNSMGVMAMQGIAAVLAGLVAQRVTGGPAVAIGIIGCASLVVSVALIPGLRRTKAQPCHSATEMVQPGLADGAVTADPGAGLDHLLRVLVS
jgi:MFS family permease